MHIVHPTVQPPVHSETHVEVHDSTHAAVHSSMHPPTHSVQSVHSVHPTHAVHSATHVVHASSPHIPSHLANQSGMYAQKSIPSNGFGIVGHENSMPIKSANHVMIFESTVIRGSRYVVFSVSVAVVIASHNPEPFVDNQFLISSKLSQMYPRTAPNGFIMAFETLIAVLNASHKVAALSDSQSFTSPSAPHIALITSIRPPIIGLIASTIFKIVVLMPSQSRSHAIASTANAAIISRIGDVINATAAAMAMANFVIVGCSANQFTTSLITPISQVRTSITVFAIDVIDAKASSLSPNSDVSSPNIFPTFFTILCMSFNAGSNFFAICFIRSFIFGSISLSLSIIPLIHFLTFGKLSLINFTKALNAGVRSFLTFPANSITLGIIAVTHSASFFIYGASASPIVIDAPSRTDFS